VLKRENTPPNIFFNLEKRNYSRKVISELELEDSEMIMNKNKILSEIENYFANLYSLKTDVSENNLVRM